MEIERLIMDLTVAGVSTAVRGLKEIEKIADGKDSEVVNEIVVKVKEIFANNREPNEELHYNGNRIKPMTENKAETSQAQTEKNFCDNE